MRILIAGGVGTGKTTLARQLATEIECRSAAPCPVFATDDALWLPEVVGALDPFFAANEVVAGWMERPGPWIIEGVRVPHALAIIMRGRGREAPWPFDPPMIYLTRARYFETRQQTAMSASTLAAARHCEGRLGVPVHWAAYEPDLARELCDEFQA